MEGVDAATAKFLSIHSDAAVDIVVAADALAVVHAALGEPVTAEVVVVVGVPDCRVGTSEVSMLAWWVGVDAARIHRVIEVV